LICCCHALLEYKYKAATVLGLAVVMVAVPAGSSVDWIAQTAAAGGGGGGSIILPAVEWGGYQNLSYLFNAQWLP